MKTWVLYAIISMIFAGFTSVVAKMGLTGISGDLGLAVRNVYVFFFVLAFTFFTVPLGEVKALAATNYFWLGLSGVTTALSWIFYYKALKDGQVSTIALIDKGSIIVAVLLATVILKEHLTVKTVIGGLMMIAGIIVIAKK
jgi:transporter family protein